MSDIDSKISEGEKPDFLPADDPSLSLVPQARLNKKTLKIIFAAFGGIVTIAMILSFSPKTNRRLRGQEEEKTIYSPAAPDALEVTEEDYLSPYTEEEEPEEELDLFANARELASKREEDRYYADNRRPQQTVQAKPGGGGQTVFSGAQYAGKTPEDLKLEAANASPIFFPAPLPVDDPNTTEAYTQGDISNSSAYAALAEQLSGSTVYAQQNQQIQKREWLKSRAVDYSTYSNSLYSEPVMPGRELSAGTIIPIVLITGINSDLPGDIAGQVMTNVYDSYTGNNLLVPKGSKVYGSYDSQISFGQNRVLLAWDRITRPDGITITLGGMQGVDSAGYTGVTDRVDNHYDTLLASVSAGSVFDLAIDIASSAAIKFSGLDAVENIVNESSTTAKSAVDELVSKALNRQPTLVVRAGWRCNMIINKNLILPVFHDIMY